MNPSSYRSTASATIDWHATQERTRASARFDVARLAFLVGVVTASFDLFLATRIGGFTLRAHQVLMIFPLAYAVGLSFGGRRIRIPLGGLALLAWILFIAAFVPNTTLLGRSAGYAAWLLLDALVVFLAVQLFDDMRWFAVLLRWYVASFLIVSIVGLLQLLAGVSHLPAPFVTQWFIPGRWPRLNGFSFEPSYYSTYLVMGWVFCAWMIERRNEFLPIKLLRATFVASTLALIFCTSKLGWAMMGIWGCGYMFRRISQFEPVKLKLGAWILVLNILVLSLGGAIGLSIYKPDRMLRFLAAGTGLFGTPKHSVEERENRFWNTLDLVRKSPFVGYSLGGVATALGEGRWEGVRSNEAAKANEGMNVFAEVLAASGVIGFIPFGIYILTLFVKPIRLARARDEPFKTVLMGLVFGLAIELLALQFNQNILRPYLWFHIAILSAACVAIGDLVNSNKNHVSLNKINRA